MNKSAAAGNGQYLFIIKIAQVNKKLLHFTNYMNNCAYTLLTLLCARSTALFFLFLFLILISKKFKFLKL
jgi:hypothetical protein